MSIASAKSQRPQARSPWGNSDYLPFIAAEVPICTGWNLHVCSNFQDGTIPSAPVWTQGLPTLEESNLPGSIQGLYYMDSWWISSTCTIYIYIHIYPHCCRWIPHVFLVMFSWRFKLCVYFETSSTADSRDDWMIFSLWTARHLAPQEGGLSATSWSWPSFTLAARRLGVRNVVIFWMCILGPMVSQSTVTWPNIIYIPSGKLTYLWKITVLLMGTLTN